MLILFLVSVLGRSIAVEFVLRPVVCAIALILSSFEWPVCNLGEERMKVSSWKGGGEGSSTRDATSFFRR